MPKIGKKYNSISLSLQLKSADIKDFDGSLDEVVGTFVIDDSIGQDVVLEVDFYDANSEVDNIGLLDQQGQFLGEYESATDTSLKVYQARFGDLPVSHKFKMFLRR